MPADIVNLIELFHLTENWVWLNQIIEKKSTSKSLCVYHHIFCDDFSQEESVEEPRNNSYGWRCSETEKYISVSALSFIYVSTFGVPGVFRN